MKGPERGRKKGKLPLWWNSTKVGLFSPSLAWLVACAVDCIRKRRKPWVAVIVPSYQRCQRTSRFICDPRNVVQLHRSSQTPRSRTVSSQLWLAHGFPNSVRLVQWDQLTRSMVLSNEYYRTYKRKAAIKHLRVFCVLIVMNPSWASRAGHGPKKFLGKYS